MRWVVSFLLFHGGFFFLHIVISLHVPLQSSERSSLPIGPQIITRLPTACLNTKTHIFEWVQRKWFFQTLCILRERGMQAVTFLVAMRKRGNINQRFLTDVPAARPLQKTPNKAAPELWDILTQGKRPSSQMLAYYLEFTGISSHKESCLFFSTR